MSAFNVSRRKAATLAAATGFAALAFFAGWRNGGLDRGNYAAIYLFVSSESELADKLLVAKDLAFLIISVISNYVYHDARLAFLATCIFSLGAKYYAVKVVASKYLIGFFLIYACFLAPGLEFAAMRSALAIGFLLLAIVYADRISLFAIFSALSIISHISLLPVVFLAARPINKYLRRHISSYVILFILVLLVASKLIELVPRGLDYAENKGTLLAYAMPTATLLSAYFIYDGIGKFRIKGYEQGLLQMLEISQPIIYGLIAISFGISSTIVTASTRYLEIAWCLLLLPGLVLSRKSWFSLIGFITLIAMLSYLNTARRTWLAVIRPDLFQFN